MNDTTKTIIINFYQQNNQWKNERNSDFFLIEDYVGHKNITRL